ncbi:MAG: hypothetical protein DRP01_08910 [Archaeoglobales archaeon]|nr:MAG: hypothetical protein DRP01_08910 [Archaeoglobales archaeon]
MGKIYKKSEDVPSEVLVARLRELSAVIADKSIHKGSEFSMRIPAECDRDADIVLSEAAIRLGKLEEENSRFLKYKGKSIEICDICGTLARCYRPQSKYVCGECLDKCFDAVNALQKENARLNDEIKRLRQYEKQCNDLSMTYGESLVARGVPAIREDLAECRKEQGKLKSELVLANHRKDNQIKRLVYGISSLAVKLVNAKVSIFGDKCIWTDDTCTCEDGFCKNTEEANR